MTTDRLPDGVRLGRWGTPERPNLLECNAGCNLDGMQTDRAALRRARAHVTRTGHEVMRTRLRLQVVAPTYNFDPAVLAEARVGRA